MYIYCKRNKSIKQYSFGKNNKGHITIRGKQGVLLKLNQLKNMNYTYIFLKEINNFIVKHTFIKLKVIKQIINYKLQRYMYLAIILNSSLRNQYKFFPITKQLSTGDFIYIGGKITLTPGNLIQVQNVPCGSLIHNIEHIPNKGAVFVKNSKVSAFLVSLGVKYATVKLPSGEIRFLNKSVFCIYGELDSTPLYLKKNKAGVIRNLGGRPKVRGVAMNACDHPHGGGEGKNSIARNSSYSP